MKKLSLILLLGLFSCEKEKQPQIGKFYIHSFRYLNHPNNPFVTISMDTVKVLDAKEGYVLYQFNNGYKRSDKIEWFNKITREIK